MDKISLHFNFSNLQGELDLDKAKHLFEMAQKLNIHHFNTCWNEEVYPNMDELDLQFATEIKKIMDNYKMEMTSYHFIGAVLDGEDLSQKRVRHFMDRSLAIYSKMQPKVLVVHPGTFSDGGFKLNKVVHQKAVEMFGEAKVHQLIVDNLRYFAQEAEKYNLKIAIENIYGGRFYSQIDELINLVEEINHNNAGYCLDVGHGNIDKIDITQTIERMGKKLFEVHLHDNNGEKDQHLPLGLGIVNWINVRNALVENNYNGTITYEFYRWPLDDYEKGLTCAVDFWRSVESVCENGYFTSDWRNIIS